MDTNELPAGLILQRPIDPTGKKPRTMGVKVLIGDEQFGFWASADEWAKIGVDLPFKGGQHINIVFHKLSDGNPPPETNF